MSFTLAGQYGPVEILLSDTTLHTSKPVNVYSDSACTTLATLYTDDTKASTSANPAQTDALGNLTFFAAPALYYLRAVVLGVEQTALTVEVKADDADLVHTAGTQTVAGVKTFSSAPVFSAGARFDAAAKFKTTPWVDVTHPTYGAIGDGTTDDAAALQAAATAATGGVLFLPGLDFKTTAVVTVPADTVVVSEGAKVFNTTAAATVLSLAAGVKIFGHLEVYGTGAATWSNSARLISVIGTVGSYKTDVYAQSLYLHDSQGYGLLVEFGGITVDHLKVYNVAHGGAIGLSIDQMHLRHVDIDMNDPVGDGSSEAYGVGFSRRTTDAGNLTSQPRSKNWSVVGTIKNVQIWEGFDCHGAEHGTFDLIIKNCKKACIIGPSKNSAGTATYAPRYCRGVVDIDSEVTDGSYLEGVVIQGSATEDAVGCRVDGIVRGHGDESSATSGGFKFNNTEIIEGNLTAIECSPNSFVFEGENDHAHVNLHSIDPWSETVAVGRGAHMRSTGDNDIISVGTYHFGTAGRVATYVNTEGFRVSGNAGDDIEIADGYNGATTPVVDANNKLRTSFRATVHFPATTNVRASMRVPAGTAPASPVDGDIWTTTAGMYVRINGGTVGPLVQASAQTYAASNVTPDRTFDADSTTTEELADVVGTLIADLRTAKVVL